jgi:thymidylate synthase
MSQADLEYATLVRNVMIGGEVREDRTGVGTRSLFGQHMFIAVTHDAFPVITQKRVAFKTAMKELVWMMRGETDARILQEQGCHIWDEWATEEQCRRFGRGEGDLGPVYGHQMRNFDGGPLHRGFDQLKWLIDEVDKNPYSRRLLMTMWHPDDANKVAIPPCPCFIQLYVEQRTHRLHMMLYQRSADLFLGVPFDMAQYAVLLAFICHVSKEGYEPGVLHYNFGDAHIYNNHQRQVQELLAQQMKEAPRLEICDNLKGIGSSALSHVKPDHFMLHDYDHGPVIKAEVAV